MIAPPRTGLVGLLGYPVEHSLSPAMHNAAFRAAGLDRRYTLCPCSPQEFDATIKRCLHERYMGWNVTVPHKERMVAYLHEASAEVRATGACNTVRVEGKRLVGHNTDIAGFLAGLDEAGGIEPGSRAVLLGAGGAARAVGWTLAASGHPVLVLARKEEQAASLAEALSSSAAAPIEYARLDSDAVNAALDGAALLVNCTQAGMWPHIEASPLPEGVRLSPRLLVYDLVYRPRPTRLLEQARTAACRTQDGLAMLVHQGVAAFEIWTGLPAPVGIMKQACLDALQAAAQHNRKQGE